MMEYYITGKSKALKGNPYCLVLRICGDRARAEEVLHDIIHTDKYAKQAKGHYDFKIEQVKAQDAWWNKGGLD